MHGKNYSLHTYYNSVLIFTLSCQVAELSERLTTSLTMKRSRKLSRSGWRDRQKISILVECDVRVVFKRVHPYGALAVA